jgi:hypothetical protein
VHSKHTVVLTLVSLILRAKVWLLAFCVKLILLVLLLLLRLLLLQLLRLLVLLVIPLWVPNLSCCESAPLFGTDSLPAVPQTYFCLGLFLVFYHKLIQKTGLKLPSFKAI